MYLQNSKAAFASGIARSRGSNGTIKTLSLALVPEKAFICPAQFLGWLCPQGSSGLQFTSSTTSSKTYVFQQLQKIFKFALIGLTRVPCLAQSLWWGDETKWLSVPQPRAHPWIHKDWEGGCVISQREIRVLKGRNRWENTSGYLPQWPWASYFNLLSGSLLIYKTGIMTQTVFFCLVVFFLILKVFCT